MSTKDLPAPFNLFVLENESGSYKDFELKNPNDYPIPGVRMFADYGCIPGYLGEDGHDLDLFVGEQTGGLCGYFLVMRNDVPQEHKIYVNMSKAQLELTISEYKPVLIGERVDTSMSSLLALVDSFKTIVS